MLGIDAGPADADLLLFEFLVAMRFARRELYTECFAAGGLCLAETGEILFQDIGHAFVIDPLARRCWKDKFDFLRRVLRLPD